MLEFEGGIQSSKFREIMDYIIRPMQDRDILQAIEIDREAFPTQWPHPTYSSLKQELRNRLARYIVVSGRNETTPAAVEQRIGSKSLWQRLSQIRHFLDHDRFFGEEKPPPAKDYVIGVAGFWIMVDEAHITTIATRNAHRRQGIGEWLLISVIDVAMHLSARIITLEVRLSNKQAQALYQKYGFQKAGVRRSYYSDNGEDALLMTTDTMTSASFQSHFQQLKQEHQQRWKALYEVSEVT